MGRRAGWDSVRELEQGQGRRTEHAPVDENAEDADCFFCNSRSCLELNERAVCTDDTVRAEDEEGGGDPDENYHEEGLGRESLALLPPNPK